MLALEMPGGTLFGALQGRPITATQPRPARISSQWPRATRPKGGKARLTALFLWLPLWALAPFGPKRSAAFPDGTSSVAQAPSRALSASTYLFFLSLAASMMLNVNAIFSICSLAAPIFLFLLSYVDPLPKTAPSLKLLPRSSVLSVWETNTTQPKLQRQHPFQILWETPPRRTTNLLQH
jgi:hypothetical protein